MTNNLDFRNKLYAMIAADPDPVFREYAMREIRKTDHFWCDAYHLTMAQSWFLSGTHEDPSIFEMTIRQTPFGGSYALATGLGPVLEWLDEFGFSGEKIQHLQTLRYANGAKMFCPQFLEYLRATSLRLDIDAVPEGTVTFNSQPIFRANGPKWQAAFIEGATLNSINSATLIATKFSRIVNAACGRPLAEFGLRRMQELFGVYVTRAAICGGANYTSNMDASFRFGAPIVGTHAHCFVLASENEYEAFKEWLRNNPDNATVLIDTNDTIAGVKLAIRASIEVGVPLKGVRLDSGDLARLSKEVRSVLNAAGMNGTKIFLSNDLDEEKIENLLNLGATFDVACVGTHGVTGGSGKYGQAALGGVYKLVNIDGRDVMKVASDEMFKSTNPGATETLRILDANGNYIRDIVTPLGLVPGNSGVLTDALVSTGARGERRDVIPAGAIFEKPMIRVVSNGVVDPGVMNRSPMEIGNAAGRNLAKLSRQYKILERPDVYPTGLEASLHLKRQQIMFGR